MINQLQLSQSAKGKHLDVPFLVHEMVPQTDTSFHCHDFIELVLVKTGRAWHILGEQKRMQQAGDIFIIPRGHMHAYQECSADFTLVNIMFIPESLPMPLLDLTLLPGGHFLHGDIPMNKGDEYLEAHCDKESFKLLTDLTHQLLQEGKDGRPGYLFTQLGLFMALCGYVARLFSHASLIRSMPYSNIEHVITYVNQHFREKISLRTLCHLSKMSRSTLERNFSRITGSLPTEYQLRLKIAEAARLLHTSALSLAEIALGLGFNDSSYFGKQFKKIHGLSPGQYRKIRRKPFPDQIYTQEEPT